jgi:acylphosphatase
MPPAPKHTRRWRPRALRFILKHLVASTCLGAWAERKKQVGGVPFLVESSDSVRRDVLFHGRVQGVGFRYTARQIAGRFRVTGYVQNLPDGRVRVVAEAERSEVDRFLAALAAEMADYIHGQDDETKPATGEFSGFEVRK